MTAIDPRGLASLNPGGLIGRIYVGDHKPLLHIGTKDINCGNHGFRYFLTIYLWE